MQGGPGRGAEGFGRKGIGGTGLAGGGGDGSGGAEGRSGTEDGADVAGVLHACKDNDERRAFVDRSGEEVFELREARDNQGGHALWVFGVGDALEEAIGGGEDGEGNFG